MSLAEKYPHPGLKPDLVEDISDQWSLDGSMAKEESYEEDVRKARKAAKR